MAFDSRAIDRSLPASSLVVGSVFKDDAEKLHSDLIDLDVGIGIEVGIRTGVRRTASGGRVDVEPLGRLDDEGDVDGDGEEEDEEQEELSELEDRFPLPGKTGSPPCRKKNS